jgi:hypothetical protein
MALDDDAMIARVRDVMDAYSRQDFDVPRPRRRDRGGRGGHLGPQRADVR